MLNGKALTSQGEDLPTEKGKQSMLEGLLFLSYLAEHAKNSHEVQIEGHPHRNGHKRCHVLPKQNSSTLLLAGMVHGAHSLQRSTNYNDDVA